jgi:hypothetical protein
MNSGDWVESLTALEYNFGKWEIHYYNADDYHKPNPKLSVSDENNWDDEDFYTVQQLKENATISYFSAYLTRSEPSEK